MRPPKQLGAETGSGVKHGLQAFCTLRSSPYSFWTYLLFYANTTPELSHSLCFLIHSKAIKWLFGRIKGERRESFQPEGL
jgi:hypothetical protein